MSSNSLYFASTILHLYAAASIAADREDETAHLIFIDQPEGKEFPLYSIVKSWKNSPFESVQLFHGRFNGLINKLAKRKLLFKQLEEVVNELKPANIFVGNDRRIEFQFSMHITTRLNLNTQGHYMDEGTFTYVGRKASSSFGDSFIDNWLKKLSYGLWWKNPKTVGESDWINQVHVAFPDLIDERLKKKSVKQLNSASFTDRNMLELSKLILNFYKVNTESLLNLDALYTLPHESLFNKNPGYKHTLLRKIDEMKAMGFKVAAKYHPRNSAPDVLELSKSDVALLPAGVSFEAMLPLLPPTCHIVGDLSSTLLIARWLRPELQVTSVCSGENSPEFIKLFDALSIDINYA